MSAPRCVRSGLLSGWLAVLLAPACGDITEGLSGLGRLSAKPCQSADDCVAPMACCLAGVALAAEANGEGDTAQPRCLLPDEYCEAYDPHLVAGSPCQRGGQSLDSLGRPIAWPGLDECRVGLICCPSTLTCSAAEDCPAVPVEPEPGDGPAPPSAPETDAGAPNDALRCAADPDCEGGLLCCGISYAVRAGTCVSPRACGATEYAEAVRPDGGLPAPDAAPASCTRPVGAPNQACTALLPQAPQAGLALWMDFDEAALCDTSGLNHSGALDVGGQVIVGGIDGTGTLVGPATVPVYEGMAPQGGLTVTFYGQDLGGGRVLEVGTELVVTDGNCGDLHVQAFGARIDTPCGILGRGFFTHIALVADGVSLGLYGDGQAQAVVAAGPPPADLCGTLALGSPGVMLDRLTWWTRGLPAAELCPLAGRPFDGAACR